MIWPTANDYAKAIIQAWYPGAEGGRAVAQLIFGDYSPSGRLPVTFYHNDEDLPAFTDYAMTNRTYRFREQKPLYPFGYGLSYTRFAYSGLRVEVAAGQPVRVFATVQNIGGRRATRSFRPIFIWKTREYPCPCARWPRSDVPA